MSIEINTDIHDYDDGGDIPFVDLLTIVVHAFAEMQPSDRKSTLDLLNSKYGPFGFDQDMKLN